ncbi:Rad52/Rad22 family DNA repair protein [Gemmatimonas sp.]|uniref:Rad52/Rad22 family DNA repair protein n=1 Tax=Gemmatimonas sp. TaxID=1962908 RepID=UPI00286DBF75|nr:Rad52/Rad22 family DNA repair protein [Gemmatimonas sp.]
MSNSAPQDTRALFAQLAAPFAADELDWRIGRSGIKNGNPWAQILVYIDARAARKRLNDVLGQQNWRIEYNSGPGNGVLARLSIRVGDEWIAKEDGADTTDIEATKGGLSGAFKRAAAVWGIGEYLYDVGNSWADFTPNGANSVKIEGTYYKWSPPQLNAQFIPAGNRPAPKAAPSRPEIVRDEEPAPETRRSSQPDPDLPRGVASARSGYDNAAAAKGMTADKARTMKVPFGKMKGEILGDVIATRRDDVKSGRDWAATNNKFVDYVAAVDALLAA